MVQTARKAIFFAFIRLNSPVAHSLIHVIAAQSILLGISRCNRSPEVVSCRFESADDSGIRKKSQRMAAPGAKEALEKHHLIAITALEDLHVNTFSYSRAQRRDRYGTPLRAFGNSAAR